MRNTSFKDNCLVFVMEKEITQLYLEDYQYSLVYTEECHAKLCQMPKKTPRSIIKKLASNSLKNTMSYWNKLVNSRIVCLKPDSILLLRRLFFIIYSKIASKMSFSKTLEHIGNENTGWELWKICLSFSCVGTAYYLSHVLELRYNFPVVWKTFSSKF